MSNNDIPTENIGAIEDSLKGLLDRMLDYFQRFIKSDKDLQELEEKLNDYENLTSLVKIIDEVFQSLTQKIEKVGARQNTETNENYDELEKIVQKYEGEIRSHIQIEQQLKLYAESLQSKVEESEKVRTDLLEQTKTMIGDVKRDNQKLAESCKKLKDENKTLTLKLKEFEDLKQGYEEKLASYPYLQERISALEKVSRPSENSFYNNDAGTNRHAASGSMTIEPDNIKGGANTKANANRKVLKSAYNPVRQQSSPLRISNRNPSLQDNRNSDYLKVKVDVNDNEQLKDLEALKRSYQQRRNSHSRERYRHLSTLNLSNYHYSNSISKTRELKSMYSQSNVGHNSSNTSIVYLNKNTIKPAKEPASAGLHKKSRSSCASPKTKASLTKKEFEKFLLYTKATDTANEMNRSKYK